MISLQENLDAHIIPLSQEAFNEVDSQIPTPEEVVLRYPPPKHDHDRFRKRTAEMMEIEDPPMDPDAWRRLLLCLEELNYV